MSVQKSDETLLIEKYVALDMAANASTIRERIKKDHGRDFPWRKVSNARAKYLASVGRSANKGLPGGLAAHLRNGKPANKTDALVGFLKAIADVGGIAAAREILSAAEGLAK